VDETMPNSTKLTVAVVLGAVIAIIALAIIAMMS
jgi:hypothetical protein